jgi:uncharacterized surface protein with fasciclin (FAS1) repeats
MKANYSKFLTNIAGVVGVTGFSLLITVPSQARETLNPDANIFQAAAYNGHQSIQANSQVTSAKLALKTEKSKKQISQSSGSSVLNPRPSIFNEPPYNGRTSPSGTPSVSPRPGKPPQPGIEVPPPNPDTSPSPTQPSNSTSETENVLQVAESAGSFKTLIKALQAAGLTQVLQGQGPFTIFAPTDDAFAKLPPEAVRDLLKPENKEVLVKVLTYHVVAGKVLSSDLKSGQVNSLQGDPISVKVGSAGVSVNDAKVIKADIPASNGVIHVIDNVILPPSL